MKENKLIISGVIGIFIMAMSLGVYWTAQKEQLSITIKGQEQKVSTFKKTVEELLEEENITYDEDDIITPSLDTELADYMDIKVTEVKKLTQREYQNIEFETELVEDENLQKDITKVVQEGEKGKKEVVYELTYNDGELVNKELTQENIYKDPTQEIIKKGTKEDVEVVSEMEIANSEYMKVESTAYAGDGITATGTVPKWGTIAVDPKVIPYGTKVYIPQFDMTFTAEDCGGAIKGNMIDIFMNSENEAYTWGRRTIDIYVIG